jgi:hypothetical protein
MRFMTMVKGSEATGAPPRELMDVIGELGAEAVSAGAMLATGGLHASAASAPIRLEKGRVSVTDGPFTETKELVGGYATYDVKSKDEAVGPALLICNP